MEDTESIACINIEDEVLYKKEKKHIKDTYEVEMNTDVEASLKWKEEKVSEEECRRRLILLRQISLTVLEVSLTVLKTKKAIKNLKNCAIKKHNKLRRLKRNLARYEEEEAFAKKISLQSRTSEIMFPWGPTWYEDTFKNEYLKYVMLLEPC